MVTLDLVKSAQAGNRESLTTILRLIERQVYQTAFYMLRNEQDALDATQEALIRIFKKINTYQEKALFKTWVQKVVTNICIDYYRRNKPTVSIEQHELTFTAVDDVESQMMREYTSEQIHVAIDQLPDQYRAIIVLRYMQDFSYQEIADSMNLPLNTVKSYIYRAKQLLQVALQDCSQGGVRE